VQTVSPGKRTNKDTLNSKKKSLALDWKNLKLSQLEDMGYNWSGQVDAPVAYTHSSI
jgi:hypothetical protein